MKRMAILINAVIFLLNITPGFGNDNINEDSSSLLDFKKISNTFQGVTKSALISVTQFPNYLSYEDRTRGNKITGFFNLLKKWCCCCFGSSEEDKKEEKNRSSLEVKNSPQPEPMNVTPKNENHLLSKKMVTDSDSVQSNNAVQPSESNEITQPSPRTSEDKQPTDDNVGMVTQPTPQTSEDEQPMDDYLGMVWDDNKVLQKICEMAAEPNSTKTNQMYKHFRTIENICRQMNSLKLGTIETILTNLNNFKYLRKLEPCNNFKKKLPEITYEPFPKEKMNELDELIEKVTEHKKMLTDKIEEEILKHPRTRKKKAKAAPDVK